DSEVNKDNLPESIVTDAKDQAQIKNSDLEIPTQVIRIDFEQVKNRKETQAESQFSRSYKLILEDLKLTDQPVRFQIAFDRGVTDVTSVVILGHQGESDIKQIAFNNKNAESEVKKLFVND